MRSRPIILCLLALLGYACGSGSGVGGEVKLAAPPPSSTSAALESFHSQTELIAAGFRVVSLDNQHTLLCAAADDRNCVCQEALACEAAGNCVGFEQNVKGFRDALAAPRPGHTLTCRRAETGRCGDFRYFDFNGDIERHEMRWFDASGRLVGQRNWTDHPAYCMGRSRVSYQGRVPKCNSAAREQLICGEAGSLTVTPLDDLLRRAGKAGR